MLTDANPDEEDGALPERECQYGMHVFLAQRVESGGYYVDNRCCFCGMLSIEPDEDGFIAYSHPGDTWH